MDPRYVMGDSDGGRGLGVPFVMLPPDNEPRDVPAGYNHVKNAASLEEAQALQMKALADRGVLLDRGGETFPSFS